MFTSTWKTLIFLKKFPKPEAKVPDEQFHKQAKQFINDLMNRLKMDDLSDLSGDSKKEYYRNRALKLLEILEGQGETNGSDAFNQTSRVSRTTKGRNFV